MSFLLTPPRRDGESAQGYLHRLASENALPFRVACAVARDSVVPPIDKVSPSVHSMTALRRESGRFCPACLAEAPFWRHEWQTPFADACPRHGCWLLDACTTCKAPLNWNRERLLACDCGTLFTLQHSSAAPAAVLELSAELTDLAAGRPAYRLAPLHGLSLSQAVRLVRVIGGYGALHSRMPQKISRVDRHSVSWSITSYAAEVLSDWPLGFEQLLDDQRSNAPLSASGRLPGAFRGLYLAIYRGLREPAFDFLRTAFENYVRFHWAGGLSKRNRRLAPETIANAAWISAKDAAARLGISKEAVLRLIETQGLVGAERSTKSGRRFWMVHSDSLADAPSLGCCLPVSAAARLLGLRRSRLARLLGPFSPLRQEIDSRSGVCRIDKRLLEELMKVVDVAKEVGEIGPGLCSLDHVLRHWALSDHALGLLVEKIASGEVTAQGRKVGLRGLPALLFPAETFRQIRTASDTRHAAGLSIPQVARMLKVKQEVAYFLVRRGFLQGTSIRGSKRPEWRLSEEKLLAFQREYVFARDLTGSKGAAVRKAIETLAAVGVRPCSGPGVDTGRQVLFRRTDVAGSDLFENGGW